MQDNTNRGRHLVFIENKLVYIVVIALSLTTVTQIMSEKEKTAYGTELVATSAVNSLSPARFNVADLTIDHFGTDKHGNIFLNVMGKIGASKPNNSEQLFSYLFFTNKGIYAVSVSEGTSFIENLNLAKVTLNGNNCITSSQDIGKANILGNTLTVGPFTLPLRIQKVETVQFNMDDAGTCIGKVFDSAGR